MKINTMSIVCGTMACNAKCPFCIAHTTPATEMKATVSNHAWRNLEIACRLAGRAGATTCLITGKGEPTLYHDLLEKYIKSVGSHFPFVELQTNGMRLPELNEGGNLASWYYNGMTTVALSAVSHVHEHNQAIYGEKYIPIEENVKILHDNNLSVRLSIMVVDGYGVDSEKGILDLINFARDNKVEQLTVRPIVRGPDEDKAGIGDWIQEHSIDPRTWECMADLINSSGDRVLELPWGAVVYDIKGQNVCIANCLTTNESDDNMRQIIFYPDGKIGYDWKYEGARLL